MTQSIKRECSLKQGQHQKEKVNATHNMPKRQNATVYDDSEEEGFQHHEISQCECAVCFGHWEEDGTVEWLKCTNSEFGVWSYADCLERSDNAMLSFVYYVKLFLFSKLVVY